MFVEFGRGNERTGSHLDFISTASDALSNFVLAAAGNPLSYFVVFAFCAIDGFFPPVPSESLVVALASLIPTQGNPNPWLLGLVAGLGAFVGDNVAYLLGRSIGTTRFAWMRRKRLQHAFAWAGYELRLRPVSLILVARFVPIGRVAVNLVAGATGFSHRTFVILTCFSSLGWASYSVLIGVLAGQWFKEHHLLGIVIAVAVAIGIGVLIDRIVSRVSGNTSLRK
ncbi:alkaline phosphatase [Arthrobacter sp. 7749]|jgi:membrane-associated protein|uniref:DedA family protein n=1 Tax=Paeniglutamicibacter terrestris TaxID=2723403 RepID=A0ABX1G2H8_9MICC|nr:alkaline phosphatase [Arthrobacter sp. 7749]NKG20228.1 DedA family protein [Paeniglutamicibacter terrestris]